MTLASALLAGLALVSCLGLGVMLAMLERTFRTAPVLQAPPEPTDLGHPPTSCTVVVPAYNEADNIGACVLAILASEDPCPRWSLLVVDDDSSDATAALARAAAVGHPRFGLLAAGARPAGERWVGKNWACHRAS